jgi:hypothetical protein
MTRFQLANRISTDGYLSGTTGGKWPASVRQVLVAAAAIAGLIVGHPTTSLAVIISSGSGNPTSTTITGFSPSLSNQISNAVGVADGAILGSADYIGNGYVITARHVTNPGPVNVVFGGTTYFPVAGTTQFFGDSDIIAYQVLSAGNQHPNVTPLQVSGAAPVDGETVTAVGFGQGATGAEQLYYYDGTTFATPSLAHPANVGGYNLDGVPGVTERWGQGTLTDASNVGDPAGATGPVTVNGFNSTDVFSQYYTGLEDERANVALGPLGNPNEFLVTGGDSGGALINSSGQLIGILETELIFNNQSATVGLFGNASGAVSLADFAGQINSFAAPEPSSLLLAAIGFGAIAWRFRRQRSGNPGVGA